MERKKYTETGKRAEVARNRTIIRSGFSSEEELVSEIRKLFEVEKMSFRMVCERVNLGKDAVNRFVKEHNIKKPDHGESIRAGVMDIHGVENVMDVEKHRKSQVEGVRESVQNNLQEILNKRNSTRKCNLRSETVEVDRSIMSMILEFLK